MIYLAKKNGAHGAKFQTYKADKLASKNSNAYWDLKKERIDSQYKLFSKYDKFTHKDYKNLSKYCSKLKIDFLSTPFDLESVDFLNNLVPAFKISSSDITNYPLLKKISKKKKPIILSTGASSMSEIKRAVKILRSNKNNKIVIMHCILNYPTDDKNANLSMIKNLKKEFPNFVIGYSDHTLPDNNMTTLSTAYVIGARVLEKHFTYNKNLKGNDHYHAMDAKDLKFFSNNINKLNLILGKSKKEVITSELKSRKYARRGISLKTNVDKNQKLSEKNLICLRPEKGIKAIFWKKVIGKKASKKMHEGHQLKWSDIR